MEHKILIFTTSEGHYSIGKAILERLEKKDLEVNLEFREEYGNVFYSFFYRFFPNSFAIIFRLFRLPIVNFLSYRFLLWEHDSRIEKSIKEFNPSLIFNTSWGFTPSLTKFKKKYHYQFINIVPNPRTYFFQDLAQTAELNGLFDNHILQQVKTEILELKTQISGWFVRSDFQMVEEKTRKQLAVQLKISINLPTILIVTGSEGMPTILSLVALLLNQNQVNMQIVVATGNNLQLQTKLQSMKVSGKNKLLAIPFTDKISQYMQVSDFVIGKAGPNSIFEAVACGKPFFATSHIPGLEDGNLEIIRDYKIGWVEENSNLAS